LDPSQFFIKRIIGLPGETVKIEGGKVIINSDSENPFVLDETAYLKDTYTVGNLEISLANNEYFVLGDNRQASSDSRKWGELNRRYIIGRAWIRAWPFNRVKIID
jgi:signal peptidase I